MVLFKQAILVLFTVNVWRWLSVSSIPGSACSSSRWHPWWRAPRRMTVPLLFSTPRRRPRKRTAPRQSCRSLIKVRSRLRRKTTARSSNDHPRPVCVTVRKFPSQRRALALSHRTRRTSTRLRDRCPNPSDSAWAQTVGILSRGTWTR